MVEGRLKITIGVPYLLLFCTASLLAGIIISPLICRTLNKGLLRLIPSDSVRLNAADRLIQSREGKILLYQIAGKPDAQEKVRETALSVLCDSEKPWNVCLLLPNFREPNQITGYREILASLNYSQEHHQIVRILKHEYNVQRDADTRETIAKILNDFAGVP